MDDLIKNSRDVEFKKLGDFLHYIQPAKYIVNSTNYSNDFNTPVLTAGKSFILGYTNEDSNIYIASKQKPVIIFDDFTSSFKWVDFPFKIKSSAAKIIIPRNIDVNIRFFYYLMSNLKYTPSSHSRQWIAKYSKIIVPVPSIKEQERIVKILDKLTELTADLTAELTASIKQYEYYSNLLISNLNLEINWKTLKEIGIILPGLKSKNKQDFELNNANSFFVKYTDVFNDNLFLKNINGRVFVDEQEKQNSIKFKDLLITASSESLVDAGAVTEAPSFFNERNIYLNSFCRIFRPNNDLFEYKFLKFIFKSKKFKNELIKTYQGTTRFNLSVKKLENILIPIPTIQEQQILIKILDKFETLTSNLEKGLPKEIELINKQYEYYRNKLLSFEGSK